ncbi:WD40-repeat-containing domain protein [Cladochytrium replicatum]|nr:WD40-repeat-containing domain protein [Cladochytrium replicatum]
MRLNFQFSNLCGTVYLQGNLLFTPDGNSVISPVGNRITVFDVTRNKAYTFPFENRRNISQLALSPDGSLLISVDEEGHALLVNFARQVIIHRHDFKERVRTISFSPNGRFIAVSVSRHLQVWRTPGRVLEFAPFVLYRTVTGHFDDIVSICWTKDSRYFLTAAKDLAIRFNALDPNEDFVPSVMTGHKDKIVGMWFAKDGKSIYTVSRDGALFIWSLEDETYMANGGGDGEKFPKKKKSSGGSGARDTNKEGTTTVAVNGSKKRFVRKWRVTQKHFFNQNNAKVVCASYHSGSDIIVVGFNSGIFGIWEVPDFNHIHTLSISQSRVDTVSVNTSGEWLAFGCSRLGQLLVWEWQSESYVLRQHGHRFDMTSLAYSPDGQFIVTGGDDGKIKVWNTMSGFCFVTFSEHSAGVSAVEFAKRGQVVFSASLDGTVRAYDLVRYRNFRTFTSPSPVQFSCLAVDPSGEVVCAGSNDTFEVFVWSMQTGKLVEIISGHEGPLSAMAFSPVEGKLATGSWDKTVRLLDVFKRDQGREVYNLTSEVLSLAYRPDGKEIAVATLDGNISFWDVDGGTLIRAIEGRKDISGGRSESDRVAAVNNTSGKAFTSLCYTADGSCIIAGGNSKYVCIYDVANTMLLRKFQISHNLSLDAMLEILNSKNMTEAGPLALIDDPDWMSDVEDRIDRSMPGVKRNGDFSERRTAPQVRSRCIRFGPTNRTWAAATTEGLVIYSLDDAMVFDPFDLELDITPETIDEAMQNEEYLRALVMSFRLGEKPVITKAVQGIPSGDVALVVHDLPPKYLDRLVRFLVEFMEKSPRLEFALVWSNAVLTHHSRYFKDRTVEYAGTLRALQKGLSSAYEDLSKV